MAIKAYLDNYEFLEADIEAKDPELMESIEIMLREELRRLIKEHASIEQIEAKIAEINSNLDKVLALGIGLAEEVVGDPRLVYVDNIRMLLDKAVEEYEEGEYEEAWSFAVKAYLDNYEFLEHDVEEQNEELNDEVERMLRDELQQKINDRAPVSEVKELAREISAKLDAVEVIVPEFPVGLALVMTSIVGITVAMTRAKKFGQGRRSFFLLVLHSQKITRITADALRSY
jgi:high-affinity iron transporter